MMLPEWPGLGPPYQCMSQLVSDLEHAQLPLPSPMWSLPAGDDIIWDGLASTPNANAPVITQRLWRIAAGSALLRVCIFKIMFAYDPKHQWLNTDFGYITEERWMFMDVLHRCPVAERCTLETDLITQLGNIPGCYNDKPGGEGISKHSTTSSSECYCYDLFAPAGSGLGVHEDRQRRKQSESKRSRS